MTEVPTPTGRPPGVGVHPPGLDLPGRPLLVGVGAQPWRPPAAHPGGQATGRPVSEGGQWPVNGARYRPPIQRPPAQLPPGSHLPLGGRVPRRPRRVRALNAVGGIVAVGGTLGVVASAFALSFDAIRDTAIAAYVRPSIAPLFPVAVDGAMAVAVVCAVLLRTLGRSPWYPWAVVLSGAMISVGCNALHAYVAGGRIALPREWAMAVSAMPAVLLALSVHLVVVLALAARATEQAPTRRVLPPRVVPAQVPAQVAAEASVQAFAAQVGEQPARAPEATAQPDDHAPTGQQPKPPTRPTGRSTGRASTVGTLPTVEQLAETLGAHHGTEKLGRHTAGATLRAVHGKCSDVRVRAARDEHNRRNGHLGEGS